jgi:hypothetical protein
MLSFYLAFLYLNKPYYYYDTERIVCMSQYLFEVQQHNRLKQKGLLKRFSIDCIGKQPTMEEMKEEKTKLYNKLKNNRTDPKYKKYFFRYKPNVDVIYKSIPSKKTNSVTERVKTSKSMEKIFSSTKTSPRASYISPQTKKNKRKRDRSTRGIFNWLKY